MSAPTPEAQTLRAAFAARHVRLPLHASLDCVGVILDEDDREVMTVDAGGERPDAEVVALCRIVAQAINDAAGQ